MSSKWVIIQYSRNTIQLNAYSLISHEWRIPLIKFMVRLIIHVKRENTYLFVLREYCKIFSSKLFRCIFFGNFVVFFQED